MISCARGKPELSSLSYGDRIEECSQSLERGVLDSNIIQVFHSVTLVTLRDSSP